MKTVFVSLLLLHSAIAFSPIAPVRKSTQALFSSYLSSLQPGPGGDINGSGPQQQSSPVAPPPPTSARTAPQQQTVIPPPPKPMQAQPIPPPPQGGQAAAPYFMQKNQMAPANKSIAKTKTVMVQGGSLKTWSFASTALERVQVLLKTEGRPLDADVELWQGPDNTPHKMRVYVENGAKRPFNTFIETPRGPNTIAVRNIAHMEFPLAAEVSSANNFEGVWNLVDAGKKVTIQGGALKTWPFEPSVESVQIALRTDGRPLTARIELLQGPNNNKQVIEIYTEDGLDRPFFMIVETPGSGNVIRVQNTAPVEFPLTATVETYVTGGPDQGLDPVIGGDK